MQFELGEDDRLLCDAVADFGRQHVAEQAASWDAARALPASLVAQLGELGLLAMRVPESDGGAGLSMVAAIAVLEELARFDASVALTVGVHNLLGGGGGESLIGYGRCDAITTRQDGTLTATCRHALLPNTAARLLLTDADSGAAFLVERGATGFTATRDETLGVRAADLGALALQGVSPLREADAPAEAMSLLVAGAIAVGVGTAAMLTARDYALERQQFGQAIANYQAIQWKLADMATGLDAARLMVRGAAVRVDVRGGAAAVDGARGSADLAAAGRAVTKAADVAVRTASDALQIHGGYGYTREFPVERQLRDARFVGLFARTHGTARRHVADEIARRFA